MGRKAKPTASRGKPRKNSSNKRRGEYTGEDFDALVGQLRPLGLYVRKMEGDGNCLFRAFADQILGDCEEHQQFRDECCDIMTERAEEFELFHADDEEEEGLCFEAYVSKMRHSGRWGSQLELMALCQRHDVNAIVHQAGRLSYEMGNAAREARCIQLSYHDGEHYNSIRFAWDLASGQPAQHLSLLQLQGSGEDEELREDVREVRELLPPDQEACVAAIRAALARASGDASAAAEFLLMEEFGGAAAPTEAEMAETEANQLLAEEESEAAQAPKASGGRQSKAERKQAKTAEERRLKEKVGVREADERMALLGKQLLSV